MILAALRLFGVAREEPAVVPIGLLSDADLLRLAKRGDEEAPRELVRRHGARLARVAYAATQDRAAAEDVVQETLLRAIAEIDRLRDDNRVVPWLSRIAHRIGIDGRRKTQRESPQAEPLEGIDPTVSADGALQSAEDKDQVARAMRMLPPRTRELLALRYDAGLSVAELAIATGKTEVAVRKELQRAREKLRTLLAPWFEEA